LLYPVDFNGLVEGKIPNCFVCSCIFPLNHVWVGISWISS
jgi:hypothetical protein